jgi:hypothetical protein
MKADTLEVKRKRKREEDYSELKNHPGATHESSIQIFEAFSCGKGGVYKSVRREIMSSNAAFTAFFRPRRQRRRHECDAVLLGRPRQHIEDRRVSRFL